MFVFFMWELKHQFNGKWRRQFNMNMMNWNNIQWEIGTIVIQYDHEKLKKVNIMMKENETTKKNWNKFDQTSRIMMMMFFPFS